MTCLFPEYDVIVVGAGHAGSEAAYVSSAMGAKTLLITMDLNKIAQLSCNPAVGGIAKGQIVREIDALGGNMGVIADLSMIQFKLLNRSKGPAMWSPRAQIDRVVFSSKWRESLEKQANLFFLQDSVVNLLIDDNSVNGVVTELGITIRSKTVILTNGTFLNGLIHVGHKQLQGGRMGDKSSSGITEKLIQYGFTTARMKTGTPVRIDGRTVDFSSLIEQKGEYQAGTFSFLHDQDIPFTERSCYIAHTNSLVHDVLKRGFADSPLFSGAIHGVGPRYCPSIEDKLVTFADKTSHQLFLEPEGQTTHEYYLNGFSSSLPWEIQLEALRQIEGFKEVQIFRPGYAIEYDYYDPTQLQHTLETKLIANLFFAGQINGTTGYEEADAQGLIAGINATLKVKNEPAFILQRDEAYIGVLIDDLVTKGVDEPYRMFTSRAEYRILLRQDNADERLTEKAQRLSHITDTRIQRLNNKISLRDTLVTLIQSTSVSPEQINPLLLSINSSPIKQKVKLKDILARPHIGIDQLLHFLSFTKISFQQSDFTQEVLQSAEIQSKYAGYIQREKDLADKLLRLENIKLSTDIQYDQFQSISTEGRQKLNRIKPVTIAQAARIPGVSPSDINVLLIYLGR